MIYSLLRNPLEYFIESGRKNMSEQCNWRTREGVGWAVCQKSLGHEGEHVVAGRYFNPAISRDWEEGPKIMLEMEGASVIESGKLFPRESS